MKRGNPIIEEIFVKCERIKGIIFASELGNKIDVKETYKFLESDLNFSFDQTTILYASPTSSVYINRLQNANITIKSKDNKIGTLDYDCIQTPLIEQIIIIKREHNEYDALDIYNFEYEFSVYNHS